MSCSYATSRASAVIFLLSSMPAISTWGGTMQAAATTGPSPDGKKGKRTVSAMHGVPSNHPPSRRSRQHVSTDTKPLCCVPPHLPAARGLPHPRPLPACSPGPTTPPRTPELGRQLLPWPCPCRCAWELLLRLPAPQPQHLPLHLSWLVVLCVAAYVAVHYLPDPQAQLPLLSGLRCQRRPLPPQAGQPSARCGVWAAMLCSWQPTERAPGPAASGEAGGGQ